MAERRGLDGGLLGTLVPKAHFHCRLEMRVAAEGGNLIVVHRATLEGERVDGRFRELTEIAGFGCAEKTLRGDVEANAFGHDRREERFQYPSSLLVVMALLRIVRRI